MTAKATQFGQKTFTSWLIESVGTVPLKRRKDHPEGDVDNTVVLDGLVKVYPICPLLHYLCPLRVL
jgi:glycerol-3-phosphate O-acyltransferase / dihydroxyacetone phosphate acyltransferase